MRKKFYITTPIYYVNAKPHIGHSYTNIAADAVARFFRLKGVDTFFLTGTDEHGQKVEKAAKQAGRPVQEFVDELAEKFKDLWRTLDVEPDDFIRTTEERHIKAVRYVLNYLYEKGDIYKDSYTGWYCVPCETFWTDGQVVKEGGKVLCPDCRREVDELTEENYFFRLSKYQDWLVKYIKDHPDFVKPEGRYNEVLSFLERERLNDLCISRPKSRFSWGIEIPFSPEHITYVWFDALINYISALGYPEKTEAFERFWPADVHLIGKDILRQHAIYWPIMLHALDLEIPYQIFAHGWWLVDNKGSAEKMSKSKGNIVDPYVMVEDFGVDVYRYFLLREIPLGVDGVFSYESVVKRYNGDLANDFGNLVYRVLSMAEKYLAEGVVRFAERPKNRLVESLFELKEKVDLEFSSLNFYDGLAHIWEVINQANKFIEEEQPWTMRKEGRLDDLKRFMYILLETLRIVSACIYPVMPSTAKKVWEQLGIEKGPTQVGWDDVFVWGVIPDGTKIKKYPPLFPRREEK